MVSPHLPLVMKKVGCTSVYSPAGDLQLVTLLFCYDAYVLSVEPWAEDSSGNWSHLRMAFACGGKHQNRPQLVERSKLGFENLPVRIRSFKVPTPSIVAAESICSIGENHPLGLSLFKEGMLVDVISRSIGKGFAGAMKRHGFGGLCSSHGVSLMHRAPGSTGQCQDPGRRFKGKRMPGNMGNDRVTVKGLKVVYLDSSSNIVAVHGSIPGHKGIEVLVKGGACA